MAGVGAVLAVLALCAGVLASLVTANGLLTDSVRTAPALASLAVAVLGFAVAVLLAGPSRDWLSNPYW